MPSITRRQLLAGGLALSASAYGGYRLKRGATDATFESWQPSQSTWPLIRYDPANTAYNPHATPPQDTPSSSELVSFSQTDESFYSFPIVGHSHLAIYGSQFGVYPRTGGTADDTSDKLAPFAGFGPDNRLHAVRKEKFDASATLVGYEPETLHEVYRHPLDADHPDSLTIGSREVSVGFSDRTVRVFDTNSGRSWEVPGNKTALADERLYAAGTTHEGTVAYTERNGLDRRVQVGPERAWSAGFVPGHAHPPAVANERLVQGTFAGAGGVVVAFDTRSGERLWEPRPLGIDVATPALVGDRGYTAVRTGGEITGFVAALDLTTGETIWRDAVEWHAFSPVVGANTLIVIGEVRDEFETLAGMVRAYDRTTGDELWTHTFEGEDMSGVALVEDRVLVTTDTALYELR